MALNPSQFDLRPNMRAKPNSQGTLFQVDSSARTPESRQPRKYSPERLREVTANAGFLDPQKTYPPRAAAVAAVRATVARSTVPVEHMRGAHFYTGVQTEGMGNAAGRYLGPPNRSDALIQIAPMHEHDNTVIHEIGHHVSGFHEGHEHAAYEHPEQQGTEEAFAENYADVHYRDRRGRSTTNPRPDGKAWVQNGARGGLQGDFLPAFRAEREHSPAVQKDTAAKIAARSAIPADLPRNYVRHQIPLLNKVTSDYDVKGNPLPDWDYNAEATDMRRERKVTKRV